MADMINVKLDIDPAFKEQAKYVFRTFGLLLGVNFEFTPNAADAHIHYGGCTLNKTVHIPSDNYADWLKNKPMVIWSEGVPVMCAAGPRGDGVYSVQDDGICFSFDMVCASFYLLSRQEELIDKRRDAWNCFSGDYTVLRELGVLEFPLVNSYARLLKDALDRLFRGRFKYSMVYPGGKEFSVCLIHDVDQPFRGDFSSGADMLKRGLRRLRGINQGVKLILRDARQKLLKQKDPYLSFDDYIEIEKGFGFKSSFNFAALNGNGNIRYDPVYTINNPRIAESISRISSQGWDIGLHASYDSYIDLRRLSRERRRLQEATGSKIGGVSQHYLRLDVSRTWDIQSQAGFDYDTSLGYNEAIGFRAGIAAPFFPYSHARRDEDPVLEIPLAIMDSVLFEPSGGGADEAIKRAVNLLNKVKRYNGCVCILWHLQAWDSARYSGWIDVYKNILEYLRRENAWVVSAAQAARYWIEKKEGLGRCAV